ncbi:MAG: hypothetical protein ACI845_001856 [Gammaproteobacteria bacterium]|jgi:hypothetical protein
MAIKSDKQILTRTSTRPRYYRAAPLLQVGGLVKLALYANHNLKIIMAISEFEVKRCERELEKFLVAKRPPAHVRNQLDFGYRIENQSVELIEIRPDWREPEKKMEQPFAKAMYVKNEKLWKIYRQGQDLKWHSYQPAPSVQYFEEFLTIVSEDANACFFG